MQDECIHAAVLQGWMIADEEFGAGGECWPVHTLLPGAERFFAREAGQVRGHEGMLPDPAWRCALHGVLLTCPDNDTRRRFALQELLDDVVSHVQLALAVEGLGVGEAATEETV